MAEPLRADGQRARRQLRRSSVLLPAAVAAATLVSWIVTVDRMQGMDAGPGTSLGGLGWFIGVWATMMAAMMLPSLLPITLASPALARGSSSAAESSSPRGCSSAATWPHGPPTACWCTQSSEPSSWRTSPRSRGTLRARRSRGQPSSQPGSTSFSPLKRRCLRECRSARQYVLGGWRPGWAGAVRMGLEHGAFCIGCCWGLMLMLFALGVMSITWMLVVAGLIFAEKVLPFGGQLSRGFAITFVVIGVGRRRTVERSGPHPAGKRSSEAGHASYG
jgi:Predicted metal-binding integral membrane protein (DUF2182)